jgi:hypothetical protein
MAGFPKVDEAPEGGAGIRSVLTMGSLVSPSGNEVLDLFSQFVFFLFCFSSLSPASVFW